MYSSIVLDFLAGTILVHQALRFGVRHYSYLISRNLYTGATSPFSRLSSKFRVIFARNCKYSMLKFACTWPNPISFDLSQVSVSECFVAASRRLTNPFLWQVSRSFERSCQS